MAIQYATINFHTYSSGTSDEGTGVRYLDNGGSWLNFIPLVEDIAFVANQVASYAGVVSGSSVVTSSSSLAITNASKTFTIPAGLPNFLVGNFIRATVSTDETKYMYGQITSYIGTSLVVDVQVSVGSGTFASWSITFAGFRGAVGAAGSVDTTSRTGLLVGNGAIITAAISGTDVKTLGGIPLLGSGDIPMYSKSEITFLIG